MVTEPKNDLTPHEMVGAQLGLLASFAASIDASNYSDMKLYIDRHLGRLAEAYGAARDDILAAERERCAGIARVNGCEAIAALIESSVPARVEGAPTAYAELAAKIADASTVLRGDMWRTFRVRLGEPG